ncbi:DNA-processing protein DprA [Actinospongicola halichondriae]|uniref:DNA-processing protein DprA n=1 Tax=Actinospongicola halichondriae TaxID=3236844 RepID=UPI003D46409F
MRFRSAAASRVALAERWRSAAASIDADAVVAAHREAGVEIIAPGSAHWPPTLVDDPEPPPLLFVRGDPELLAAVSVAIVGTRRCSAAGTSTARALGAGVASAGVGVVSGLALGIDGAAHRGALDRGGPVIGVVATGLDVVYPRRHRALWDEVASAGVLVSEAPIGTTAERWRFPARNRVIAALSRLVVVVESGRTGGSMSTVESAIQRQVDVGAVPGPVQAATSAGTNQLLADGCLVVRDATDVLVALGVHAFPAGAPDERQPAPLLSADPVTNAVAWTPTSLDDIVAATGLPFTEVAARLATLELTGVVEREPDGYRRVPTSGMAPDADRGSVR